MSAPDLFGTPAAAAAQRKPAPPSYTGPRCPGTGHPLRCACGAWASIGTGVHLRDNRLGTWRCGACARAAGDLLSRETSQ